MAPSREEMDRNSVAPDDFQADVIDASFDRPVVLMLGTYWCPDSQAQSNTMDRVDARRDDVAFSKFYYEKLPGRSSGPEYEAIKEEYFDPVMRTIPQTVVIYRGEVIARIPDRMTVDDLDQMIDDAQRAITLADEVGTHAPTMEGVQPDADEFGPLPVAVETAAKVNGR